MFWFVGNSLRKVSDKDSKCLVSFSCNSMLINLLRSLIANKKQYYRNQKYIFFPTFVRLVQISVVSGYDTIVITNRKKNLKFFFL
jgi:hypothetical protein